MCKGERTDGHGDLLALEDDDGGEGGGAGPDFSNSLLRTNPPRAVVS
eukprot:gene7042-5839_t